MASGFPQFEQRVTCAYCADEKRFSRADALARHMRVVHPDIEWKDISAAVKRENELPRSISPKDVVQEYVETEDEFMPPSPQSVASSPPQAGEKRAGFVDGERTIVGISDHRASQPNAASMAESSLASSERRRWHACDTCSMSFACLSDLQIHQRSHATDKPYKCPQCLRFFSRWKLLRAHQQTMHRIGVTAAPRLTIGGPATSFSHQATAASWLSRDHELDTQITTAAVSPFDHQALNTLPYEGHHERRASETGSPAGSSDGAATPPMIAFVPHSPPRHSRFLSVRYGIGTSFNSPLTRYMYEPLEQGHFRLLLLHHGQPEDTIRFTSKTVSPRELEDRAYQYYALSYAWGTDAASEVVQILDTFDNMLDPLFPFSTDGLNIQISTPCYVRPNLHAALRQLRSETEDLWIWIDALCINQEDDHEKSSQLPNMLKIYSNACSVCIWLGETEAFSSTTRNYRDPLDFIHFIVNLKLLNRWVLDEKPDEEILASFVAFANLLKLPWFRRRWVIQEVSACRQASVHCGTNKINWIDFVNAVQLFLAHIDRIRAVYARSELHAMDPDAFGHVESSGAVALVNAVNNLIRISASGRHITRLWDIESLVTTFLHFETTDPRDVVYALLPLAFDGPSAAADVASHKLLPDYSKCAHEIYVNFVRHSIVSSGSLDVICRHWAPQLPPQYCVIARAGYCNFAPLPSYVGLVAGSAFGPPSMLTGRFNGDSLVGEIGHRQYNASQKMDPVFEFISPHFTGPLGLRVKGLILGSIVQISSRIHSGIIPFECFQMAGWDKSMDINDITNRLWRTLVADRTSTGKKAPSWWRRACMHCLTKLDHHGDLHTTKVIASQSLPQIILDDYLKRVQAVVWNRKIFVGKGNLEDDSDPLFGLGPQAMQQGDLVCILFGCSVPVILRKRSYCSDDWLRYTLVGECFVYEKMDGEAVAGMDQSHLTAAAVEFHII